MGFTLDNKLLFIKFLNDKNVETNKRCLQALPVVFKHCNFLDHTFAY